MTRHLADTLIQLLNKQEDTTLRITLQNDRCVEINPSKCNPSMTDTILQVTTTTDDIIAYFDVLQVYIVEEKPSNAITTLKDITG